MVSNQDAIEYSQTLKNKIKKEKETPRGRLPHSTPIPAASSFTVKGSDIINYQLTVRSAIPEVPEGALSTACSRFLL